MVAQTNAAPEQGSYVVHSAETVGKAFANQYYAILQQSPGLVHRFYSDVSLLGRPQGELMDCSTTMKGIDEKILSYGNFKAEIMYVDAQDSLDGGVIVLVVGAMVNEDESRRNFTQTFFLAPQEKGYYVLNDILRYVKDGDPDMDVEQADGMVPAKLSEEVPPILENHISELSNGELCNPNEEVQNPGEEVHTLSEEVHNLNGELPVEEVKEEVQVDEEKPLAKVVDEVSRESWVMVESRAEVDTPKKSPAVVESSAKVDAPKKSYVVVKSSAEVDTTKKSYASIVMKDAPTTMSPPVQPKSVSKMQDRQVAVTPVEVPPSSIENSVDVDDTNNHVSEGKGYSIYCRNLPMNVTYSRIQEAFQEFGPIKSSGIQIRHTVGFSYGFVEFETAVAAENAIKASPIHIDRHAVGVEEKKSTAGRGGSFGVNNRGRYPPGRGGNSFRGDGVRGRGGHGGGRGYGRGESNRGDFGGKGGGRGFQNRSEGYQKSDHSGNGSGHMNRGGGSGYVSTRTQGLSAQA